MSRTRLVRPGFFADEDVASMSRDSRLAYVGLWTECDDAGYFEARPRQLARALFGYDSDGLAVIESALEDLIRLEKVELLPCGEHGVVPSLPTYAQQGGNHAYTYQERHQERCLGEVRSRPKAEAPAPSGPSRKTLSVAVRQAVVERDQDQCRYCGVRQSRDVTLVFDHVDNLGPATLNNIVQACRPCNRKKNHHGLAEGVVTLLPPPVRTDNELVRTSSTYDPRTPRTDQSRSESVSDSESANTTKKDVKDEVVDGANGARATVADDAPFLSDPNRAGRPGASMAPIRPPAAIAAMTPGWRTPPGPCRKYAQHANSHRLEAGEAVCDACLAELATSTIAPATTGTQPGLGLS